MPAAVETAAFARTPAWHGEGTVVPRGMKMDEVLQLAQLDWSVNLMPMFVQGQNDRMIPVPDRYGVVRSSDERILGTVGSTYKTFTNYEALSFLDGIVDDGDAEYESAGSLFGGRRIWVMMKMPKTVEIVGDAHSVYVFIATSHDGSTAITAAATPVRIVCANTLAMALNGAQSRWSVTHRAGDAPKIEDARTALSLTFKYVDVFKEMAETMQHTLVSDDLFSEMLTELLPQQKQKLEKNVSAIIDNRRTSPTILDEQRGTAWGAYNSAAEWLDHLRPYRTADAQMKASLVGWGPQLRSELGTALVSVSS